jgi:hypothetical protein
MCHPITGNPSRRTVALVEDFEVPVRKGNRLGAGRNAVPQRLHVGDLLFDREVVETGRLTSPITCHVPAPSGARAPRPLASTGKIWRPVSTQTGPAKKGSARGQARTGSSRGGASIPTFPVKY